MNRNLLVQSQGNLIAELAARFSGKLLLRREIPLDEKLFQRLVNQSYFTPTLSIKRKKFHYICERCGNRKRRLFANIPCNSCKKNHLYCRKCIDMGRVMECEPLYYWTGHEPKWKKYKSPCSWTGTLTPEQKRAANRIVQAVKNDERELLVWAVTGAGKTEMLFPAISHLLALGKRICIATPRTDVVRELIPRMKQAFIHVPIQGLYSGSPDMEGTAQFIIATTHQLLRYQSAFDLIIIDEIDAFPFHSDPSLAFAVHRAKKSASTSIYLTATPRKKQRVRMYSKKLPHIFVPIRFHRTPLPVPRLKMCFQLKKNVKRSLPPPAFIHWLKTRSNPERQILLFVPTILLAQKMDQKLGELLVKEKMIRREGLLETVHAADQDREEKIQLFRSQNIQILITTTILERGVTFPSVDVAVIDAGHTVFDEAALVQIAGRAGRSPSDPTGEVIFFHDGKTEAMEHAIEAIVSMNKRGGFR
ncbi:MAG TPA: DEAD/DEAH box helicase family protein [Virgibacillus sp.]|nr:DEAD/DEAH box helicase family protein [Virgibacillus sp.]HLR65655.1 DEAD/DEAH box helicase family protein [Virgibacillus sp.]